MKKSPKTIFNVDRLRLCLAPTKEFSYQKYYDAFHKSRNQVIDYGEEGFYLIAHDAKLVNDKDIEVCLYIKNEPDIMLGTFQFNNSQKYSNKCFFTYNTKVLYEVSGRIDEHEKYNFFSFPFHAFEVMGLHFNNVTLMEIACDTEANIVQWIRSAVSDVDTFHMVLLGKSVADPDETLDGFWEFYPRSRKRKNSCPTLYVRPRNYKAARHAALKVYDKARELVEARPDKQAITQAWNEMSGKIYRMEVAVPNEKFKDFCRYLSKIKQSEFGAYVTSPKSLKGKSTVTSECIEHVLYMLGLNEEYRQIMFDYFANDLLHFKVRNRDKTQVSLHEIALFGLEVFKSMKKRTKQPVK